jgi:predicted small secreted protein
MKRLLTMLTVALLLAGCNTVAGFGKDVEQAGGAIERSADKSTK